MSIHGFVDQNGQIQKYDYNDLENKPTIPTEVLIDDTLTEEGQAADAKAVGDALANVTIPVDDTISNNSTNPVQNRVIYQALQNTGLSQAAKTALLAIFQHVAYIDEYGQDYYNDLEEALNGGQSYTITYNLTGCASSNTSTQIFEGQTYTSTITASSGYTLEGAIVAATMGGQTVTGFYNNGTISIPNVTGDLVITVTATSSVASISAVFSPDTDTPIDISTIPIANAYINTSTRAWATSSDSASICIPVNIGKSYAFSWSETNSSVVGTIFRWGFSSTNTASGQKLTYCGFTTPQETTNAKTVVADKEYLVIQCSSAYMSSILSNGYLSVTELAGQIYANDSLDALRQYLTVTATYSDTTTATVSDYTLSGHMTAGTQTITVSYGGKSDTFTVSVTDVLSEYTTVGSPTITSDYKMTTADGKFIKTSFNFDNDGKPWEIRGKFHCDSTNHPAGSGKFYDLVNFVNSSNDSERGILLELNRVSGNYYNNLNFFISSGDSSWDIANPLSVDMSSLFGSDVYFKFGWSGFSYYVAVSADGVTWNTQLQGELQSTTNVKTGSAIGFGNKRNIAFGYCIYVDSLGLDIDGAPYWRVAKGG